MSARLLGARRLVIKIGSALLVDETKGALRRDWLDALADDIAAARGRGQEVVIVSSGAIALGRRHLDLNRSTLKLEEKQAAAATGQIRLAHAYQESLARHGITVAQILLTLADTEQRRQYLNARSTLGSLIRLGAVPVINENDTVATEEIRFGDNDRLAARVAQMISADCLVMLSDVAGLYTADPARHAGAEIVPEVREIDDRIMAMAGETRTGVGSGGMVTKLAAARIAMEAGCHTVICRGAVSHPLAAIAAGGDGTWFLPRASPRTARKQWIAAALEPAGRLTVDDGAARALAAGKSLLPAGVRAVAGRFQRGDAVVVVDQTGNELARGLCAYSDEDARRIAGHKSSEIEALLGYRGRDEMIHRDDMAVGGPAARIGTEIREDGS